MKELLERYKNKDRLKEINSMPPYMLDIWPLYRNTKWQVIEPGEKPRISTLGDVAISSCKIYILREDYKEYFRIKKERHNYRDDIDKLRACLKSSRDYIENVRAIIECTLIRNKALEESYKKKAFKSDVVEFEGETKERFFIEIKPTLILAIMTDTDKPKEVKKVETKTGQVAWEF